MTKSDPVFTELAEGLRPRDLQPDLGSLGVKPADLDLPGTIKLHEIDLDLLRARERLRAVKATEHLAELAEQTLAAQLRIADAAEQQANALEVIAALFASVIGAANAKCGFEPDVRTDVVNFLRTGRGIKDFQCDEDVRAYAAEENESN